MATTVSQWHSLMSHQPNANGASTGDLDVNTIVELDLVAEARHARSANVDHYVTSSATITQLYVREPRETETRHKAALPEGHNLTISCRLNVICAH